MAAVEIGLGAMSSTLHVGLDTMLTTDKAHEALRQVAALAKAPTGAPI